jgi:hypothetical protein
MIIGFTPLAFSTLSAEMADWCAAASLPLLYEAVMCRNPQPALFREGIPETGL